MKTSHKVIMAGIVASVAIYVLAVLGFIGQVPPGTDPYCEGVRYVLDISGDSLKGEAVFSMRPFQDSKFRVLSCDVALQSLTVDGKERPVVEKDGYYVVHLRRRRSSTVEARFVKNIQTAEDRHNLFLKVPWSSRNLVELRGIRGQHVVLNGLSFNEFEAAKMPDEVSLNLAPTPSLDIAWQRSKRGMKAARIFARRYTVVEVADGALNYRTMCDYQIRGGKASCLRWLLDENCREISVDGAGIHSTVIEQQDGKKLVEVNLTSPIDGEYRVELSYSSAYENETGNVVTARPVEILNEDEYIAIGSREEVQMVPVTEESVRRISPDEVPAELIKAADVPIFNAFHCADGKSRLSLAFTKYGQAEGVETAVDKAEYEIFLSSMGEEIVRGTFEIRNTHHQFMPVRLPKGAILCSVYSLDEMVRPLRMKDGMVLLPLEKSIESFSGYVTFPIDICYIVPRQGKSDGDLSSSLPALGIAVSYLKWQLILPQDSDIRWGNMNVHYVEQFTDEQAMFALEYARARAAGGPDAPVEGGLSMSYGGGGKMKEAMDVIGDLSELEVDDAGERDGDEPVENAPVAAKGMMMAKPKALEDKFSEINFGSLYEKVTNYSKKVAKSVASRAPAGKMPSKGKRKGQGKGGSKDMAIYMMDYEEGGEREKKAKEVSKSMDLKKKLSLGYSRKAQKAYRGGKLDQAKQNVSRALESNVASEQALQLGRNVQVMTKLEKAQQDLALEPNGNALAIEETYVDVDDLFMEQLTVTAGVQNVEEQTGRADRQQQLSRIASQAKTFKKDSTGTELSAGYSLRDDGRKSLVPSAPQVIWGDETDTGGAAGTSTVRTDLSMPQSSVVEDRGSVLLRYNLLSVPNDLSDDDGEVFGNRAENEMLAANDYLDNWSNSMDLRDLNKKNWSGYNRMNIDAVQENTIVGMLNDSYGARNTLSSNVVKVEDGGTFEIPFNTPQGVRYARVRPEIVGDGNIDLYIRMPRMDVNGVVSEEETAVRIEHGQTGVIGGISGQVAGIGVDNGLVLTINGSILGRMAPEEIKEAYTQSRMDVAMPVGDVYRFEKLLVKADEKLTVTMEVK